MRNPILSIILIVVFTFTLIGCNQQPPPITDTASLIENLKKAGCVVEIDYEATNNKTFSTMYSDRYHGFFKEIQDSGNTIEPVYLENALNRLHEIAESTKDFTAKSVFLIVNGEWVSLYEYNSDNATNFDIEYYKLYFNLISITVPTDKGEWHLNYSGTILVNPHYYKKGQLFVIYSENSALNNGLGKNKNTIRDIMEKLLGSEFFIN
jgi:hypothetical protein